MAEKDQITPAKGSKAVSPKKSAAAPKARKAKAKTDGQPQLEVLNPEAKAVGSVALHPEVFGVRVNQHLLYEAVKQYRAGGRAGTHQTKTRAMVSGSGKKPWRQKGTGRARVGETRTPLWRHGGTVHGPVPRSYALDMPKKARASALRSALSQRLGEGAVKVVTGFPISAASAERPRYAQQLKALLAKLGVEGKTLVVDSEPEDALVLSGRNMPGVTVLDASHVTVYHVLDCKTVLVSQEAVKKLEERLAP
jgi:large subunit ribosomal protein L4